MYVDFFRLLCFLRTTKGVKPVVPEQEGGFACEEVTRAYIETQQTRESYSGRSNVA